MPARAITFVVLVAAVAGFAVLVIALPKGAATAVGIAIPVFVVIASVLWIQEHVLAAVCAAIVALLALVIVAVLIRGALDLVGIDGRLPIWLGLVVALVVFTAVGFWYLYGPWLGFGAAGAGPAWFVIPTPAEWDWKVAGGVAAGLAILVILVPPFVLGKLKDDPAKVTAEQGVVSRIDALIVSDRPRAKAATAVVTNLARSGQLAPYAHAAEFEVHYSVGFATAGDGVRWTLSGSTNEEDAVNALGVPDAATKAAPAPVQDADRVVLLVVDGTPPVVEDPAKLKNVDRKAGEIARWRRIAKAAALAGTTTYALLETTRSTRLRAWKDSFIQRGTYVRRGGVVSLQGLKSQSMTDAAVRLAVAAPTAQEDYSLALAYRPILRFDNDEPAPRPLSIEALFATKKVKQCFSQRARSTECETIDSDQALKNGGTHLELPLPEKEDLRDLARDERDRQAAPSAPLPAASLLAPPPGTLPPAEPAAGTIGDGSAIYVHAVPADTEDDSLLYLDYWWYLPYNPAGSGNGAFCGPGFVIPGINCFDHVSDWEGVTVVLDRTAAGAKPTPKYVQYAQHDSVVRYDWAKLRGFWDENDRARAILAATPDSTTRPIVFVAAGTHASYPQPCTRKKDCRQVVSGAEEEMHDGELPWSGNTAPTCGEDACLKVLPTARGGRDPALWSAFTGPWGTRHCFLTYYCDSGSPPDAPGQQDRYAEPWLADVTRDP